MTKKATERDITLRRNDSDVFSEACSKFPPEQIISQIVTCPNQIL